MKIFLPLPPSLVEGRKEGKEGREREQGGEGEREREDGEREGERGREVRKGERRGRERREGGEREGRGRGRGGARRGGRKEYGTWGEKIETAMPLPCNPACGLITPVSTEPKS